MKSIHVLISATLASLALASTTAVAASPEPVLVPKQSKPVPSYVVSPTDLPRDFANYTVELRLKIDEKGVPYDVKPARWMPRQLAARLLPVIAQWRFTPAYIDGHPVSTEVILPLTLVEKV